MPIYEYQCNLCGASLEVVQKMSDPALTECPTCHKPGLQKLVSAAGFQLKGTGWYVTDFRDKKKPEAAKPHTETETPSTTPSDKPQSDTKTSSSTSGDKT